jgi:cobalamin biosynthesis protein CbiD
LVLVGAAENDLFGIFGGLSLVGETGEPEITS